MRVARVSSGMGPEGDPLTVFRSPQSLLDGCPTDLSFGAWSVADSLPLYDDDVNGFPLYSPYDSLVEHPSALEGVPVYSPCHPSFAPSAVLVPVPAAPLVLTLSDGSDAVPIGDDTAMRTYDAASLLSPSDDTCLRNGEEMNPVPVGSGPAHRRSARTRLKDDRHDAVKLSVPHRMVHDRWFYEPVVPAGDTVALLSVSAFPTTHDPTSVTISVTDVPDSGSVNPGSSSSVVFPTAALPDSDPPPVSSVVVPFVGRWTHGSV
jgi:hypothetical protein